MRRLAGPSLALAALALAACAGAPPAAPPSPAGTVIAPPPAAGADRSAPFAALVTRLSDLAARQERDGDLAQALESWSVVAALRPGEEEPKRRVAELSARVKAEAQRRYREGLARLKEGAVDAARRELLLALVADPDHAEALEALKNRLEPDGVPHTVAAGESFESIAKKHYADPSKAAIVARANNLDPGGRPTAGTVLFLPDLTPPGKLAAKRGAAAPEPSEGIYDTEPAGLGAEVAAPPAPAETPTAADPAAALLAKATELFKAAKYEEAAAAAGRLADNAALGARARQLAADAWFAIGDAELKADRFAEAAAAYRKAEPVRRDAAEAVLAVGRRKLERAEELYRAGVGEFINQKLDEAIRSWEQTLALNPDHAKALKDIEKARALKQKLKDLR